MGDKTFHSLVIRVTGYEVGPFSSTGIFLFLSFIGRLGNYPYARIPLPTKDVHQNTGVGRTCYPV